MAYNYGTDSYNNLYIDAGENAGPLSEFLERRGYRYGYNGNPCQRKAPSNMPYITIDMDNGFYWGSVGFDPSRNWRKLSDPIVMERIKGIATLDTIMRMSREKKLDNNTRTMSKDNRKMERMWYTANGRMIGISCMDDDHLHNTILLVDRMIDAGCDTIGSNTDLANLLDELEDERIHRGLHLPLVPLISLDYRKGKHNVR